MANRTFVSFVVCRMLSLGLLLWWCECVLADDGSKGTEWIVGVASEDITPAGPIWMAGYASRNKPSEGVSSRIFAKCASFQDAQGTRFVLVTLDLIGIPRAMKDLIGERVQKKYGLPPSNLMLNASHTHSGPVVRVGSSVMYDLSEEQSKVVDAYNADLQNKLVDLIGRTLTNAEPSKLGYSHARCGFAMNRRLPTDKGVQNSPYPDGPVDQSVPVLRIETLDGKLRAILFGYACHNTTLGLFEISGDYAGHAQAFLEEAHPGVIAMFVMGCGGDQNPYPRGTVDLARQHGKSLATAVEAGLLPQAKQIRGSLRVSQSEVDLEFANPLNREALIALQNGADKLDQRRAAFMLDELAKSGKIRSTYAYPIQVVRFGKEMTLVALAGEVVVDFSLRLKREHAGENLWVAGYSNDVFGYVPSCRVLEEGGYEAGGAMRYTRLPGPFAPSVEEIIIQGTNRLIQEVSR